MQINDRPAKNQFETLSAYMPLFWLSLAFLAGILLAAQVHAAAVLWLILAGGALFLALGARLLLARLGRRNLRFRSSAAILISLSLTTFFLGAARYQLTVPRVDAATIAWYNDRSYDVLITGTLTDPPDERDAYTNLRVDVSTVDTGNEALTVRGLLLARVPPGRTWHYGDVVRLRGKLQTPPENEDFSYRDYLARQGIHAYMPDAEATLLPFSGGNPILRLIYTFKAHAIANVHRIFPDPEASLLAGILLGNDTGLSADVQQAFKNTGTAHIIAISGFNIAIIAALFVAIFSRLLGPRRGTVAAIVGIVFYTLLVGAGPSVVRAAIMGSLALFAVQVGRRQNGLNTLAATAAAMAVINPNTPWDVGFQLSFGATLGLILYAQPLQEWAVNLLGRRLPPETARKVGVPLGDFLLFTLAAQLTTLPIMAYQFGRISLVSLLANPFILPVQPLVEILSGLALLLSFVYLPIGRLAAWLAWPFSAYTIRAVEIFNTFPHGVIVLGDFSFLFVVLFYALLFGLTFAWPRLKQALRPVLTPAVILIALGILTYLVWAAAFAAPDGRLHLVFLDVGSADAILVRTPSGRTLLIGGGASPSRLSDALGRRLSPFNQQLDWLLVASTREQQVGALPRILDRFTPKDVLWSGQADASYSAGQLDGWLAANRVPVTQAFNDAVLDLGSGARLEVRSVSSRGAVLLVEWLSFRALLPIGSNFDTLTELQNGRTIGPVTALLLGDSGYAPSNPPEWIENLHPRLVILSVAAADPDGLPDPAVLESVRDATLLRTDRDGWIDLSTDGTGMWLTKEK
jgi:competence protein ComEC